jgi:hypothetical protein
VTIEYKTEATLFAQFWTDVETGQDPSAIGEMMIAATLAMRDVAAAMKKEGRSNIRAGGLDSKFANAWRVSAYPAKGYAIDPAAFGRHNIPYADIFETGGAINSRGAGLLWLPLPTVPKVGKRIARPRDLTGVDLFSVNRPGRSPLLMAKIRNAGVNRNSRIRGQVSLAALRAGTSADKIRATSRLKAKQRGGVKASNAGANVVSVPLFHGVASVTLRKRFDLAGVTTRVAARFSEFYYRHLPE